MMNNSMLNQQSGMSNNKSPKGKNKKGQGLRDGSFDRRTIDKKSNGEPEDSLDIQLRQFGERDLTYQPVFALNDKDDYPPFRSENEKLERLKAEDEACFMGKGNPFQVSQNSEVLMIKERAKQHDMQKKSHLSIHQTNMTTARSSVSPVKGPSFGFSND